LAPLSLILAFIPITWVNILFLGDFVYGFTFGAQKAFIFHALRHFHQVLAGVSMPVI
jgi:hypothetical protein